MNLALKKIQTLDEVEQLRLIRNECKDFMTRDCSFITKEQQIRWFNNIPDNFTLYLLYAIENSVITFPVGYGLIRQEEDHYLISGGLTESYRGKGVGGQLFQSLINTIINTGIDIKLEVLKSNIRAFAIYNKLGFLVTNDDGNVITMIYHKNNSVI